MREVAVIGYAQSPIYRDAEARNEVELLMPVIDEVKKQVEMELHDFDFVCSGSCDYLQGAAFAFVMALDALGAVPSIKESHVEMDGAWALYESWLKIQMGLADSALIYGFGKSSSGDLPKVLALQLDPYYYTPLWPDSVSLAALQARTLLENTDVTERDLAEVVKRSRANALNNPNAQLKGRYSIDDLLAEPKFAEPLRRHDCPPISDGAAAVVIAAKEVAENRCNNPAYIRGIDHRIESSNLAVRPLKTSPSTEIAAKHAGALGRDFDTVELHAPFSHQEIILRQAIGLKRPDIINRSGGPLCGNIMMASGLSAIGEVASQIIKGSAKSGLAHATSGPCLQQNLITVLESA